MATIFIYFCIIIAFLPHSSPTGTGQSQQNQHNTGQQLTIFV